MRANFIWFVIVLFLLVVIGVLSWIIFAQLPRVADQPSTTNLTETPAATTAPVAATPTSTTPLSERVSVAEPASGASVEATFSISGKAPGNWYFEASFPIQVRDQEGNVIGRSHANAQGDWMTTNLVSFTAAVNIEGNYKGPADLILLRDNPSGLPENDDSVTIPIVIK
ncbi:hypothetical protein HZC00_03120 [Candidatus Kaiserbacteria bacterium]|nr:hypothetical protein [Candidatus Kaiserbacteria bacterium]